MSAHASHSEGRSNNRGLLMSDSLSERKRKINMWRDIGTDQRGVSLWLCGISTSQIHPFLYSVDRSEHILSCVLFVCLCLCATSTSAASAA